TSASASNDRLYISTTGNVGIATVTPAYKLDVSGTANVSGELTIGMDLRLGNLPLYVRGSTDINHRLIYAGGFGNSPGTGQNVTQFTGTNDVDGPVLYGYGGGGLGSTQPPSGTTRTPKYALTWDNSQNVTVFKNLWLNSAHTSGIVDSSSSGG